MKGLYTQLAKATKQINILDELAKNGIDFIGSSSAEIDDINEKISALTSQITKYGAREKELEEDLEALIKRLLHIFALHLHFCSKK